MNAEALKDASSQQQDADARLCNHELKHLKSQWWWFLLLGILLVLCGTVAIAYPPITSIGVVVLLGALLIVGGLATVISSLWAGKWSAMLLQLLVGILYIVAGMAITDAPAESTVLLTMLIAAFFIVVGVFRIAAALIIKFPLWGWALLNGVVTLLLGVIIYRNFPGSAFWIIGLLVGIEMLLNGWTWIMLSLQVRRIPDAAE